jgi:hypothetical protein
MNTIKFGENIVQLFQHFKNFIGQIEPVLEKKSERFWVFEHFSGGILKTICETANSVIIFVVSLRYQFMTTQSAHFCISSV